MKQQVKNHEQKDQQSWPGVGQLLFKSNTGPVSHTRFRSTDHRDNRDPMQLAAGSSNVSLCIFVADWF